MIVILFKANGTLNGFKLFKNCNLNILFYLTIFRLEDNLKPILPKIDDLVIANSSKQNGLCRAKVMMKSNDETDLFKCKLIDFGLTEIFSSQNLFELSNHLLPNKVSIEVLQ